MSRNGDCIWKCQTKNLHGARPIGPHRKRLRADGTDCFSITSCRRIRELILIFWSAKAEQKFRGTRTEVGACRRIGVGACRRTWSFEEIARSELPGTPTRSPARPSLFFNHLCKGSRIFCQKLLGGSPGFFWISPGDCFSDLPVLFQIRVRRLTGANRDFKVHSQQKRKGWNKRD